MLFPERIITTIRYCLIHLTLLINIAFQFFDTNTTLNKIEEKMQNYDGKAQIQLKMWNFPVEAQVSSFIIRSLFRNGMVCCRKSMWKFYFRRHDQNDNKIDKKCLCPA